MYKFFSKLPHGKNSLAVPVSGLITEISDRKKALEHTETLTSLSKIALEEKHKEASRRIATCIGYLSTISYRLLNKSEKELFMDKNLDWESFIIFSQVILDSFSILVPLLYVKSPKYKRGKANTEYEVRSFNNLTDWFIAHNIDDDFSKEYKRAKQNWYRKLNNARKDHTHRFKTQEVLYKNSLPKETMEINENQLINLGRDNFSITSIESEVEHYLKSIFNFLTFSTHFFAEELTKSNIFITEKFRFKVLLLRKNITYFNKILFDY